MLVNDHRLLDGRASCGNSPLVDAVLRQSPPDELMFSYRTAGQASSSTLHRSITGKITTKNRNLELLRGDKRPTLTTMVSRLCGSPTLRGWRLHLIGILLIPAAAAMVLAGEGRHADGRRVLATCEISRQHEPDRKRYDGLTITQWQERIKNVDFNSPDIGNIVPGLLAIVKDQDASPISRQLAALTLGRIGRPAKSAIPVLLELIDQNSDHHTHGWAVKALSLMGAEAADATPQLVKYLDDPRYPLEERYVAIEALGQIGASHQAAIPKLIQLLEVDHGPESSQVSGDETRILATEAIGLVGPAAAPAIPALISNSRSANERIRRASVVTLGLMGPAGDIAVPALAEVLVIDESASVRDQAALALGNIGGRGEQALVHFLADDDVELRWRSAWGLANIGEVSPKTIAALQNALEDPEANVRITAAETLWSQSQDRATLIPVFVLLLTDTDRQIRIRAYRELIAMQPPAFEAKDRLTELLDDNRSYVRSIAARTLNAIGIPVVDP